MQKLQSTILESAHTSATALLLFAAFVSFVLSVLLYFGGQHSDGIFVGLWVPSILSLGTLVTRREDR